jgi:UDP-2-acetamido-3-amino-2,3-dideoxy-glucuronate N-acetyltransferase
MEYLVHPSAVIDEPCIIGKGTKIWHFCHIMQGARIGEGCVLGQNVMVASTAQVGDHVKIQNNVSIYDGVTLEEDVFCGPSCVFTNVVNPRAQIVRKQEYLPTLVQRGATIGANATILCGITIGRYAFIAAGSVVRHDVPDYALIMGVPGVQKGWMSRHGYKLKSFTDPSILVCPFSGWKYQEYKPGNVRCLDWPEDRPLPAS